MLQRASVFLLTLLAIELLDELVFGVREASWPLIRANFHLSYVQIGILLGIPEIVAGVVEPFIGILGDLGRRRALILGGGVMFAASLFLTVISDSFLPLLMSFTIFYPASGAFVSLSQASLMDSDPTRHEQNMARWSLAGSLGNLIGPLMVSASAMTGFGWRGLFAAIGVLTLILLLSARRFQLDSTTHTAEKPELRAGLRGGFADAFRALRRWEVQRWLILLEFSDLMLDTLYGYLALYFVDVVGANQAQAGLALVVWMGVGLLGDALLIPLLERVRGLNYLRFSVLAELILYPMFLLVPGLLPKLVILALLGIFNAGWYSILQAQLYSAMPGQSGTVLAVSNISGLVASLIPLGVGLAAERFGLGSAMWLLLLGPVALLVGLRRAKDVELPTED